MSFVLRQSSNTTISIVKSKFEKNRFVFQKKTDEIIVFATTKIKIFYDKRHQHLKFNFENKTYFRLYHEYFFSFQINAKLFNQKIESFLIKRKIKKFAYELNLSFK